MAIPRLHVVEINATAVRAVQRTSVSAAHTCCLPRIDEGHGGRASSGSLGPEGFVPRLCFHCIQDFLPHLQNVPSPRRKEPWLAPAKLILVGSRAHPKSRLNPWGPASTAYFLGTGCPAEYKFASRQCVIQATDRRQIGCLLQGFWFFRSFFGNLFHGRNESIQCG